MTFIGHLLGYFEKHEAIKILERITPFISGPGSWRIT
jgi:hypothetical protein